MAAFGVDIGGTTIKWAELHGVEVVAHGSAPTPRRDAAAALAVVAGLMADRGPATVGIALPGPITDAVEDLFVPNLAGEWTRSGIEARLRAVATAPVALVNDAHAMTLAEARLGAARAAQDVVCLTLGSGVGGGVVLGGALHRGWLGRAGEIGHMTIDPGGPLCSCGNRGCLETLASGPAIVAAASRPVRAGTRTALRELCGGDPGRLDAAMVAQAAAAGDAHACDVLERAGTALGIALANVCAVLAPELVVIGGGVAAALDGMRPAIEAMLTRRATLLAPPEIRHAELGALGGAIGAAEWGRDRLRGVAG
jgi:glucokinase